MQNEFEKQVQQKMEELKLVPSQPVWEKVEVQIRKEKDRRRVLFWIPLFVLIGAGLWIGIDKYAHTIGFRSPTGGKENHATPLGKKNNEAVESLKTTETTVRGHKQAIRKGDIENLHFKPAGAGRSSAKPIENNKATAIEENVSVPTKNERRVTAGVLIDGKVESSRNKESSSVTQFPSKQVIDSGAEAKPSVKTTTQPMNENSTSVKAVPVKKLASSRKWKYNLALASGWSGLGRIEFYNGQKSVNVYYSPPLGSSSGGAGQFVSYGPSAVEKGLAFTVGGGAKKELTKRTCFATGLHYDYFSNTIEVGNQVNQSVTLLNYPVSRFYYSATQYYSGQAAVLQPYKNEYHFISIPAGLDWQMLRRRPLNLSFGLSFQYLFASNALRYDYNTQSYFHNMSAFNRAQLMSGISLTYSVPLKQKPLSFGPQVQYGLTRLEKGNADNHLFSYGLKAQWQFKK